MALAGMLRHKIVFTDTGGVEYTKRAALRGLNAAEAEIFGLDVGTVGYSIRVRHSANGPRPGPRWTAAWKGRKLLVAGSYEPTVMGRELVVVATEPRSG